MAEETNHKPYRLGLALSGGGAKGFAHIGVFRMMDPTTSYQDYRKVPAPT